MLKRTVQILPWLLALAFVAGLARFVQLRFSTGEIYPEYSSFRADPIGTKAFYESLRGLGKFETSRHLESLQKLKGDAETTILFFGMRGLDSTIESLPRGGARLFISLNALPSKTAEREQDRINRPKEKATETLKFPVRIALIDPLRLNTNRLEAELVAKENAPQIVPWHGRYCFETDESEWETVYELKGKPVIIQKKAGLGKMVLCADSFLFSNEALARERIPDLLLWALGPATRIVFDETHLGIARGSSIMIVLRQYRLHGLFFGLMIAAGLWVWKNVFSFVPAHPASATGNDAVQGKTAREGVVHLLERNLAAAELPAVCLREWRKSHPLPNPRVQEAEAVLAEEAQRPEKERNSVETYRRITHLLSPSNQ